jgi:hypothetical protein
VSAADAGSYILAELGEADGKVNGELTRVLMADQVKYFKKIPGLWCVFACLCTSQRSHTVFGGSSRPRARLREKGVAPEP